MQTLQRRVFPGKLSSLAKIARFVAAAADAAGLDERATYAVQMAVDEACSNIIEHTYSDPAEGSIECEYEITDESLVITLRDQGRPFDPTAVADPELDAQLEQRPLGGLGVYLMRQLMDSVDHHYEPGTGNVLTLVKHREACP
jgi:anti-sigma regulatory factor (Ser/Thr protein kinase)